MGTDHPSSCALKNASRNTLLAAHRQWVDGGEGGILKHHLYTIKPFSWAIWPSCNVGALSYEAVSVVYLFL